MSKETDSNDAEVELMKWMTIDQLDRFSDAMQQVEEADAERAKLLDKVPDETETPLMQVLSPEDFQRLCFTMGRSARGHEIMGEILKTVSSNFPAFAKLRLMACAAMEEIVNEGVNPGTCGSNHKFWQLVHIRILGTWEKKIAKDRDFKNVKVMEFLEHVLVTNLDELAEIAREKGNPILAQLMEELAESP